MIQNEARAPERSIDLEARLDDITASPATNTPQKHGTKERRCIWTARRSALLGVTGIVLFLLLLEIAPQIGLVDSTIVPPFSQMAAALGQQFGTAEFWQAFGQTVEGWLKGLIIALIVGVVLGIVIGMSSIVRRITSSTIEFLRPIPSVALIPVVVLIYGITANATLVLVVYASTWPVLLQMIYGVRDVDPIARETARSYRFRRRTVITQLVWPTALPYAITGLRLASTIALLLEVTCELIIGTPGLGTEIATAQRNGDVATMFALIIVTGLLGVLANLGTRALERRGTSLAYLNAIGASQMRTSSTPMKVVFAVALPLALVLLWWVTTINSKVFFWPPLSKIVAAFGTTWFTGEFNGDIVVSLLRLFAGYLIALILGIAGGLVIGSFRAIRALVEPLLEFFRAVPPAVMVPVLILVAGIGSEMKVILIVAACIWPVLLNTIEGVRGVDEVLRETTRSYHFRRRARLLITLRGASPRIVAGARQSLSIAILVMVISEMFAASDGLGFTIIKFQRAFRIPEMWSGVIILGALGVILALLFRLVENRVLAWYNGLRMTTQSEG